MNRCQELQKSAEKNLNALKKLTKVCMIYFLYFSILFGNNNKNIPSF